MSSPKIFVHGSYVGNTGFNHHTRDFFRELSNYFQIKVRNYTVGSTWTGYNESAHDNEPYLNDVDKKLLYQQTLWNNDGTRSEYPLYPSPDKEFNHDFNIVLNETSHHFFYDHYNGPKIAYNVWESTLLPEDYFNKLKEYDEVWVPSKWQKECMIKQGMDESFVKVVPEGVDSKTFYPDPKATHELTSDGRFKFLLVGRWDYRKSTKEIIETFLKTFESDEPVDLIINVDNPWGKEMDGCATTEERLKLHGIDDPRIKIIHFPSREDYINLLKSSDAFVSCARAEGWNLPLIEAMACGTPSIYSNCSGQLEFAANKGVPVRIEKEKSAKENSYARFSVSDVPGNYYEPDFNHLSEKMRFVYEFHNEVKKESIKESIEIRKKFDWSAIGEIGEKVCTDFYEKIKSRDFIETNRNSMTINYLDGPFVEIKGKINENYYVEFLDENDNVVHSSNINTNMWTSCSRKYYTKWKIRVNGKIVDEYNLEGKKVLISIESKSIGDTLAWAPYAVEFKKKHNCDVVLSTFFNEWFEGHEPYKDIEFIKPGESIGCYSVFRIGWFRDSEGGWKKFESYPNQLNLIPLQKTASDILGLEYKEVNHGVKFKLNKKSILEKYIIIGPQSTAGCKEWSYENWSKLAELLWNKGYRVYSLTSSPIEIPNVRNIHGMDWNSVMNLLHHAEYFIGLGSGLSWLNWALGKQTIMINGFSRDDHEFTTNMIRVSKDLCIKCWNDPVLTFDAGDWDWCPVYKGTERQHICQRGITPEDVYKKIPFVEMAVGFDWGNSNEWYINTMTTEIFLNRVYEKFFEVEEGDIVVDFGASIGPFGYSIKDKKVSHLYCLEPSLEQIGALKKNVSSINSTIIPKGISNSDGVSEFFLFGNENKPGKSDSISFKKLISDYKIKKIDFLKTDCESGEYDIFTEENLEWIKSNVKKISGEWHLGLPELKSKFRKFRDTYLTQFENFQVLSIDHFDIKHSLWTDKFIDYYTEIIIYIDNR